MPAIWTAPSTIPVPISIRRNWWLSHSWRSACWVSPSKLGSLFWLRSYTLLSTCSSYQGLVDSFRLPWSFRPFFRTCLLSWRKPRVSCVDSGPICSWGEPKCRTISWQSSLRFSYRIRSSTAPTEQSYRWALRFRSRFRSIRISSPVGLGLCDWQAKSTALY
jgi:hypothetical protein